MRKKLVAILTVLFALVLGFGVLTACGGSKGELTINEEEVTLAIGESHTLIATSENNESINWSSSDANVVVIQSQVAASGIAVIKASGAGQATITATSESGKTAECKVTVENIVVEITGEGVANGKLQMERYDTVKLSAAVKKEGVDLNETVTWSVVDPTIVSVSEDGTVTALKKGSTTVVASRSNGASRGELQVTVVWSAEPAGYYELEIWEQNKITPNLWGYWVDTHTEPQYNTNIKVSNVEYLGDPTGTGLVAGGVTMTYENQDVGANEHGVQLFYRSSKGYNTANAGDGFTPYDESKLLLEVGANYILKMDLTVTASGTITVNGTQVDVVANQKQALEIPFQHTDTGLIYPAGDYTNLNSAVFLMMGANGTMIQAATVTIENVRWESWNGETGKLATPSLSVNGKTVTITDSNTAGVRNYTVGLFAKNAAADADPLRVVTSTEKTVTLDDSRWPNGNYELRVRVNGTDRRYADSDWSAGVDYTVSHGAVQYDLKQGIGATALADKSDTYYYSAVENEVAVETATYNDGTVTLAFSGNSNWTSMQLFYKNPALKDGERYTLTLTLTSPVAGKIRINGKMFDLVEGDNNIEVSYTEGTDADKLSMSIQFGEPNAAFNGTVSTLGDGTYTIKNIVWTPYVAPEGSIPEGAESDAINHPGTFYLWADRTDWNGANVTVSSSSIDYENKTISFAYTSDGESRYGAGVQLFYELPGVVEGNLYTVTVTIKVSVTCDIRVCGRVEHFEANVARTLTFEQKEPGKTGDYNFGASLAILMGTYTNDVAVNVKAAEVTVTNWSIVPAGETLSAPTNLSIAADKKVTFTDTNTGASYELGFFAKQDDAAPVVTIVITNGGTIDDSKLFAGTYFVKVRAVKEGANSSEWSQGQQYTVTKAAGEATNLPWGEEFGKTSSSDGTWVYWTDDQNPGSVEVEYVRFYEENGTYRIAVKETAKQTAGSLAYGFQLFHNDTAHYTKGKDYVLSVTVKSKSPMTLQLYGKSYQIPGNDQETPLTVRFTLTYGTLNDYNDVSLFDCCVPQTVGTTYEFELIGISWTEASDSDYTLGADILPSSAAMVHSGKTDKEHVLDTFLYWYVAEAGWLNCGTVVTMKKNTYENGTVTLGYSGGSVAFSVQLFYCNSHLDTTKEYLLSTTITSTVNLNITVNGKPVELKANTAQEVKVAFTPATNQLLEKDVAPWAVDIQLPGYNGDATVTFASLKWNEILSGGSTTPSTPDSGNQGQGGGQSQPSTPTGGTQMTKLNSKDGSDLVKGKWSYYAAANVTVTTATVSADGKTVTVTVSGLKAVGDFTIFYTPEGYADGQQKTLVADYLFTSTTVANCVVTLNNCTAGQQGKPHTPGYDCNKSYTGQGLDFITTGGVFFSLTLGFVNSAGVDEVPSGEITLTLSNITLP